MDDCAAFEYTQVDTCLIKVFGFCPDRMWGRRKFLMQLPERVLPGTRSKCCDLLEEERNPRSTRFAEQALRPFKAHGSATRRIEFLPPVLRGIPEIFRAASALAADDQPTETA